MKDVIKLEAANIIKTSIAFAGGAFSYLIGGWDMSTKALLIFVMIDYATGIIAATSEKRLNSRVGLQGIARKVGIFCVVAVAHMADQILGGGNVFRDGAVTFYLVNEILSILENAGKAGVPLPDGMREAVQALREKSNNKNNYLKERDH
jgi:toxin secretion/phage lysis holin